MTTTVVHPPDPTLRTALRLAFVFAAIKLAIQVAANLWEAHIGYGYFRDEFYYIACGRHLTFGYVDHGPIVALQARLSETLFGHSLAGLRLLSALAGAARVFLTGMLAWALGGRRPAQALAMLGVLLVPMYFGLDSYLSMNSCESLFWMTCLLALVLILKNEADPNSGKLWLLFGVAGGLGVLNKPSMTFFLLALLAALLLAPQRRILFTKWAAAGTALLILIALPNLIWQVHNHWPTLEFLRDGQREHKNIALAPVAFLRQQWDSLNPINSLIWIAGLVHLLRNGSKRWLGFTYLIFIAIMMALHAKDYYVAPIYPILFAAGGIAWERRFARSRAVLNGRAFAFPILEGVLIVSAIVVAPMSLPLMQPEQWLSYTKAMHLYNTNGNSENSASGPLPQFYADRFGWQEEVDQVTRIYSALPPEQQRVTGILCANYGEAGALNFLGHGLPTAISGHNNYFLWGANGYTGESMFVINDATVAEMLENYESVEVVGHTGTTYSMPSEHQTIYLAHHRKSNLTTHWPDLKHYI